MAERRLIWGLMLVAVLVRASAILVLQSHHIPRSTYEHGKIAANILAGRGFSVRFLGADGPTSQQAPIYPYLLAAAYQVGGVETPQSLLILELGQALLGGALVYSSICLARAIAPGRIWVVALVGLITALHPTLVYAATHVQVALLAATLVTASLALAFRAARTGRDWDAVACGSGLALLALTDPILGLVTPGVAWVIASDRGLRGARRPVAILIATMVIGVTPWIVRNAIVHKEFVLVKSTFGYAFWQGNCALSEGTDKVVRPSVERVLQQSKGGLQGINESLWKARHEAGYLDDIALTQADYRQLAKVSEPERSRILFRRAVADIKHDPARFVSLTLRRLRYFVFFDETNPKTRSLIYRTGHLGLTILAACGILLMTPEMRRRSGPTVLTVVLIAAFHSLTIVSARFHVPIEPILAVWAGVGFGSRRLTPAACDVVGVRVFKLRLREVAHVHH